MKSSSLQVEQPALHLNLLGTEEDRARLAYGVRVWRDLMRTGPLSSVIDWQEFEAQADGMDDDTIARSYVLSNQHISCTCRMGPHGELDLHNSVVGPDFRVHRCKGLRVCDASVQPSILSSTTNAVSMALGRMCAAVMIAQGQKDADTATMTSRM